jgi:hypothetical protein
MPVNENTAAGVSQPEARSMLRSLCDNGFDGSMGDAALALGRDEQFLADVLNEGADADDDLVMKIRGIAGERNIAIDQ